MNDARRLLVVTYHFDTDGPVGGLRWLGLTKYLARLGWKVSVVTAARASGHEAGIAPHVERCGRFWTLYDGLQRLRELAVGRPENGSRVERRAPGGGPLRRLYREVAALLAFPDDSRGWMLRAALRTRSLLRRFKPQVVVSSGPPHAAHLAAGMATVGTATRWLIDLRDPWAGPLPRVWDSDLRLGSGVFRTLAPRLERLAFGAADGVITNTQQLADALTARYPDVAVSCVPNGVDPERLPPPSGERYPGLGIAHVGTLYAGRDAGPVVLALRLLFERHPEAAGAGSMLRIAGNAERRHARAFHDAVAAAGMGQYVEMLGLLPRAQALEVVSRSRLALVLAQQQDLQVPAKLYESVGMGVPTLVVAPAGSATAVEARRVGAMVRDPDDVEGMVGVLEHLWRDGARGPSACTAPITYDAIAVLVDKLLIGFLEADLRRRATGLTLGA